MNCGKPLKDVSQYYRSRTCCGYHTRNRSLCRWCFSALGFSGLCSRVGLVSLLIHQDVIQPRLDAGYCLLEKRTHPPFWLLRLRVLRHRGRVTVLEIAIRLLSGKCLVSHSHGFGGGCARTSTWIIVGTFQNQFDANYCWMCRCLGGNGKHLL